MKQYQCLMQQISTEFRIKQGERETELEYKARILYSLLGRMGYASLGDVQEDTEPASIVHFKRRIETLMTSYMAMYPELAKLFSPEKEKLATEIYDILLSTGCLYHTDRRVLPSAPIKSRAGGLYFTRGLALNKQQTVSGIGTYVSNECRAKEVTPTEMFQLQQISLADIWRNILQQAKWSKTQFNIPMEFLRTSPPYKSGYWIDKPDRDGKVSLMRTRSVISRIYYLYYWKNGQMLVSPVPDWMAQDHQYRTISNACLFYRHSLPAAHYEDNGAIVHLHLKYLYPPAELNLIRLYSWPMNCWNVPSNFHRILSKDVFSALRKVLEPMGYEFVEG